MISTFEDPSTFKQANVITKIPEYMKTARFIYADFVDPYYLNDLADVIVHAKKY